MTYLKCWLYWRKSKRQDEFVQVKDADLLWEDKLIVFDGLLKWDRHRLLEKRSYKSTPKSYETICPPKDIVKELGLDLS